MEAMLAKDEVVIKEWNYAKQGRRFDKHKTQKYLTVTNKRIIASEEGKYDLKHDEVPLSSVYAVKGGYRKNDSVWTKIKFYISLFFCIILIGIPFAIKLNQQLKSCVFELEVVTKEYTGRSFTIGDIPDVGIANRGRHFRGANKMKVFVDKEIGRDILNSLGAIILENK